MARRFIVHWVGLCLVLLGGLAGVPAGGAVGADNSLRIAAVVNDEIISVHDLNRRIELLLATSDMGQAAANRNQIAAHVLRLLIEEKLKLQEARRLNVVVSQEETDAALKQIAGQLGVAPSQLPQLLESRSVSPQALIEQVQAEIAWIKAVQRKAMGQVAVTDEEIEARMDRLEKEAGDPEYRVAEIFLPVDGPSQDAEALALAQKLIEQLKQGARFSTLARNFSQGAAAAVGGDLGWMSLQELDPELQSAVANLAPGQAYGPVRTQIGYHILFLIDRRAIEPPERGAVTVTLSQLVLPLSPEPTEDEVQEQMARAKDIAASAESCDALIEAADAADAPLSGNLGAVELGQLDKQLRELVRPLQIGEKTEPFQASYGVAILMVCDRKEDGVNEELRDRIRKVLLNERLSVAARRMLRDLQREAFVDVRI